MVQVLESGLPKDHDLLGKLIMVGFMGMVNIILMMEILEHLVDPEAAIKKALSLLNDNGYLIITVPDEKHVFEGQSREHISKLTMNDLLKFSDDVKLLKSPDFDYAWYVAVIKNKKLT
jgi:hypothetical protein